MGAIRRVVKKGGTIGLAVLAGFAAPLLIWAAVVNGLGQLYQEWRVIRAGLLAGKLACSLDTDCPPGYVCGGGRCIPGMSR